MPASGEAATLDAGTAAAPPSVAAVRRARWAIAFVFLINGAVIGSWAPHIPLVKERLGLSPAVLGLALLGMALGALIAMPLTGAMVARFGSAAVTRTALLLSFPAFLLPVLAPSLPLLVLALILFGAANGVTDVAMNAHGVAVEVRYGRPVMSSYHGMFSLGGLIGAGLGSLALGLLPAGGHAVAVLVACGGTALAVLPGLLPGSADLGSGDPAFAMPRRTTIVLGLLCLLALMGEGAILDWSGIYLREDLAQPAAMAGRGYAAFSATMATGRVTGDALRARLGSVTLVRASAALAAGGLALAVALPYSGTALLGFALAGLGIANFVPVLFGAAGRLPGEPPATAIAAVATLGYTGFLAGPPFVGLVAEATSLATALGLVALACAVPGLAARATRHADRDTAAPPSPLE